MSEFHLFTDQKDRVFILPDNSGCKVAYPDSVRCSQREVTDLPDRLPDILLPDKYYPYCYR